MKVTLSRWKYNNDRMRITSKSVIELKDVSGERAADIMPVIHEIQNNSDLSNYTGWKIINIQD